MINLNKYTKQEKKNIAASPITPKELFPELLKENIEEVDQALAENNYIDFSTLEELFNKGSETLFMTISKRKDLNNDMFISLARNENDDIRMNIVCNENCNEEALNILAEDEEDYEVRLKALKHSNFNTKININLEQVKSCLSDYSVYEEAAKSGIYDLQLAAADNPLTSPKALRHIYQERNKFSNIQQNLLNNKQTDSDIKIDIIKNNEWFSSFVKTSDPEVLEVMYESLKKKEKTEELFNPHDYTCLTKNNNTPEHIINELSKSKWVKIKTSAASNPKISEANLIRLAKQKNAELLSEVAEAAKTEKVFENLFSNKSVTQKMGFGYLEHEEIQMLKNLINNPDLPEKYLDINYLKEIGIEINLESHSHAAKLFNDRINQKKCTTEKIDYEEWFNEIVNVEDKQEKLGYFIDFIKKGKTEMNSDLLIKSINIFDTLIVKEDSILYLDLFRVRKITNGFDLEIINLEDLDTNVLKRLLSFGISPRFLTDNQILTIRSEFDKRSQKA